MGTYIDKMKKALEEFEKVKGDIAAIHKCKNEVLSLKEQLSESVQGGYFLRDDKKVVISAPEVIIGNVDRSGVSLSDGGSTVIVRGSDVEIQGSSDCGSVQIKAPYIRQLAVDPGRDGLESSVSPICSRIVNQAVSISIDSSTCLDAMADYVGVPDSGVKISSDTGISLAATPSNKTLKSEIDRITKNIDNLDKNLAKSLSGYKSALDSSISDMMSLAERYQELSDSEYAWRTNDSDIASMREMFRDAESSICAITADYIRMLSMKAENTRRKESLNAIKARVDKQSTDFTKKSAGGRVSVISETVSLQSVDGDGNVRTNPEAGLFIHSPHLSVNATDSKGSLIKDSSMTLNVENVILSTASAKIDDNGQSGEVTAGGSVSVVSKSVSIASVDMEMKDKKLQEKALTKGSSFSVRTEKVQVSATDTEGKSTGEINLNSKDITLASMDVDKEKRTDKQMAAGSRMIILSEKMYAGGADKKNKSKLLQMVSDKVGIMADTTAEMQQGEAKAVVTLDGGNLTAGADKNELNGDTTIKGKADIKGETTAPKGSFKSLEAGSQFKSPNISDGMGAPGGGTAGKPSAKMKMEEVQKQEQK